MLTWGMEGDEMTTWNVLSSGHLGEQKRKLRWNFTCAERSVFLKSNNRKSRRSIGGTQQESRALNVDPDSPCVTGYVYKIHKVLQHIFCCRKCKSRTNHNFTKHIHNKVLLHFLIVQKVECCYMQILKFKSLFIFSRNAFIQSETTIYDKFMK